MQNTIALGLASYINSFSPTSQQKQSRAGVTVHYFIISVKAQFELYTVQEIWPLVAFDIANMMIAITNYTYARCDIPYSAKISWV